MSRFWDAHAKAIDLTRFRASDQYLWQPEHYPYREITRHLLEQVECTRLREMGEDGAYGARVWGVNGYAVSRDLLDSLLEIRFLEKHLPRFGVARLLDIGAGYGRLAHRLEQTHPELEVWCTDAVDVSIAACDLYRRVRRGTWRIAGDLAELRCVPIDVAVNIHSWSECTGPEVDEWVNRLAEPPRVPWLFVIPHDKEFTTSEVRTPPGVSYATEPASFRTQFRSIIEGHGYRLHACEPNRIDGRSYYLFRLHS